MSREPRIPFSSESLLREAIRALLSRIPEVSVAQLTHGAQEIGKDIVFSLAGGLGERMLCACVVKNAPLTGKSETSKGGALSILNQIEQTLLNPKRTEYGIEIPIQKVFVVTPYDLPESTLNAIFGHLRDRAGKIEFIGGTRLFELFRKYWPDFFADEFTAIREHIRSTTARLQDERALQQLAINYRLCGPDRTITRYYVQPNFHQELNVVLFDPFISSAVYGEFRLVSRALPIPNTDEVQWIPVKPTQIFISSKDIEQSRVYEQRVSQVLEFLVNWDYCEVSAMRSFLVELTDYGRQIEELRNRHVQPVKSDDPQAVIREVSQRSQIAELTISETELILNRRKLLSETLGRLLARLAADAVTTSQIVVEKTFNGITALNDPRYQIAVKINDINESSPPGLFAAQQQSASPGRDEAKSHNRRRRLNFPSDFLNTFSRSVLIVGAAGYGKTSFCRWHALNDAERFAKGHTDCVPSYFSLPEIARGQLKSFEKVFLDHVGHSALVPASNEAVRESQRFRLYLDGLDEIPHSESRMSIVELVRNGTQRWQNVQVILTTRDYIVGPWLSWLPKFHLSEFTDDQIQELLGNWLDKDPERIASFNSQLKRMPTVRRVLGVPLLATLVILVFRLTNNLPSGRKKLYESFVELLNAGWDLAKGVQRGSKFGSVLKLAVLKRIAYLCHQSRLRQFPEATLRTMIRGALKSDTMAGRWQELLDEILQDGVLIRAGGVYSFAHLSFQEFLAAASLIGDPGADRRTEILREFLLGDTWWKEVLSFYLELSSNMQELSNWIMNVAAEFKGKDGDISYAQSRILLQHLRTSFPELAM
jgi:hypothetical protein